jgi:hypothetical protein
MKTLALIFLSLFTFSAKAQGTLQFYADLRPTPATTLIAIQVGEAWLDLNGNQIAGHFWFTTGSGGVAAQVAGLNGNIISESTSFTFPNPDVGAPVNIAEGAWPTVTLSDAQIAELKSGEWSAVITSQRFPQGEIFGQFQMIPEPSSWIFLAAGILGIFVFHRERNR